MKLSFVIPAYNAEGYLARCLDSILSQPWHDHEIVLIDDGSTDGTGRIAADYAARHPGIRVFTLENGGQGRARSFGIDQARGEYIWFVDSDDWLLPSTLPRVAAVLQDRAPDVMVINFEFTFDDRPPQPSSFVPPHLAGQMIVARDGPGNFAAVSCWSAPPWRLISRRSLLVDRDIRFAHGVFYEDHPFAIKLMLCADSVFVDAPVVYAYYQRQTSTTKVNDRKAFDFLPIRKQSLALLREYGVYEPFAGVSCGYVAPFGFYDAHVSAPYRKEFLERLDADLTDEEVAFVEKHGDEMTRLFVKAIRAHDPEYLARNRGQQRLMGALSPARFKRVGRRVLGRIRKRMVDKVVAVARRLRPMITGQSAHAGQDYSGRRFLKAGTGARIEDIMIDVRVKQEPRTYVEIGEHSHVGGYFVFERGIGSITVGSRSSIGSGCQFICTQDAGIHIGNNVMLSWRCTVIDTNSHSLDPDVRANDAYDWKCGMDAGRIGAFKDWSQVDSAPIVIEDGVWVGFETAIMKGVRIGKGAVIGSRSMVTRDVPPYTIAAGSPARFVGLVPRSHWTWEEVIEAMQGDPQRRDMLIDSFMHRDLPATLKRYRESEEFRDTAVIARRGRAHQLRMLDVGGGNGTIAVAFALEGFDVTMVEPSEGDIVGTRAAQKMIEYARSRFDGLVDQRVRVINGTIEDVPLEGRFDIVYCRQVAHHFVDPVASLRRMCELLAPDGVAMLVREHVIFDDADRALFLEHHPLHRYYQGENAYTVEQYVEFAERAGFRVEQVIGFRDSPINFFPHSATTVAQLDEKTVYGRPYTFVLVHAGA